MLQLRLVLESFRFALGALKGNILRTILSLLGVTIGIFSIITVFTIVDSLERGIRDSFSFIGENIVYVQKWPWGFSSDYPWWKYVNRPEVSINDFRYLEKEITQSEGVALFVRKDISIKQSNNSMDNVYLMGVTYAYNKVADVPVEIGRYFTGQEVEASRNRIIIGYDVAVQLFSYQNPIGKMVKIKGLNFFVIGVMKKQGANFIEGIPSNDQTCIIPYGAFLKLYYVGSDGGASATVAIKGRSSDIGLLELEGEIRGYMRSKRGLRPRDEDDFAINRPEMLSNNIASVFQIMGLAGWVIGGFSMLVGGFGIANIMFVSVKERTSAIGIQKSLGAKNYFILFQFLFESIFLSAIGGLVGLFLVFLVTLIPMGGLTIILSLKNIALGLGVSIIIGILSGIIPASIASNLDPVEAIRAK